MLAWRKNLVAVIALALLTLAVFYVVRQGRRSVTADNAVRPQNHPAAPAQAGAAIPTAPKASSPPLAVQLNQVLAEVNGRVIKLADILPVSGSNATAELSMDKTTLDFYLKRAVDRELILETARKKGIALADGEYAQLTAMQDMRHQPEPGGVARLNYDPATSQWELQNATAFMLQTELMAAQGESPDVTESQVAAYYQQHHSDFASLPTDPAERQQAWQELAVQIRKQLAPSVRASYNSQLAGYMSSLESQANITVNPPADLAFAR